MMSRAQSLAHLGSWELDLQADRLTWSDEVYRIFGLEPREFDATYGAFLGLVHPDDRGAVDEAYAASLRENRDSYEIKHRIIRKKTGAIRYVHEKCAHLRDGSGRIVRSVGMVHDVTERQRAEEALRESERRFRTLAENSPDFIARLDRDLRITYANSHLLSLAGASAGTLIGRTLAETRMAGDLRTLVESLAAKAREAASIQEAEIELPATAGSRAFSIRLVPKFAPDGPLESYLVTGRNVTLDRKNRQELLSTRNYLNKLLNYANAPIIVWNPRSEITMFNHAFERLTGYAAAEVLGRGTTVTVALPKKS